MSQWRLTDEANSSPIWSAVQLGKDNTRAEANALYGNTTANAYFNNATIGSYGVSAAEAQASQGSKTAGWALRTELSNGRVRYETLVATKNISGDGSDDPVLPDYTITIATQPANASANATADEQATFTVVGTTIPAGGTIGYQWTYANGDALGVSGYSGDTTDTLTVDANTVSNGESYKVELSVTGAANVVSSNATITITT